MEITLTKDNFDLVINNETSPVLVDFWASWCGPCMMMGPILQQIENKRKDVIIGKVNVDEQPELAYQYRVESIPLLILFNKGKAVYKMVGLRDEGSVLSMIDEGMKK